MPTGEVKVIDFGESKDYFREGEDGGEEGGGLVVGGGGGGVGGGEEVEPGEVGEGRPPRRSGDVVVEVGEGPAVAREEVLLRER